MPVIERYRRFRAESKITDEQGEIGIYLVQRNPRIRPELLFRSLKEISDDIKWRWKQKDGAFLRSELAHRRLGNEGLQSLRPGLVVVARPEAAINERSELFWNR